MVGSCTHTHTHTHAYIIEHDFAQQHVLERHHCARILLGCVALERFIEVRVGRLEVFLLSMQNARLQVECSLKNWRTVNGIGRGASRRESSLYIAFQ